VLHRTIVSHSSFPPPYLPTGPAHVRARHPQTLLRLARAAAPEAYPAIEEALGVATRATVESAIPSAWLPIELDVDVMEAVARRLGPIVAATLVEARQREEVGSALFNGFVQSVLRVSGASPAVLLKQLPAGWKQLFRDCGWIEIVEVASAEGRILFHALPRACVASDAWMAALPVGLGMLYEIIGVKGSVECRTRNVAEGSALIRFRWHRG
jgi:hypothetical protein